MKFGRDATVIRLVGGIQAMEMQVMMSQLVIDCNSPTLLPPFAMDGWKIGPNYKHVGLQVRIHETNFMSKAIYRNALDITYPAHFKWCQVFWQWVSNSILTNLTWPNKIKVNHNLSEHQRRIVFMEQFRRCLAKTGKRTNSIGDEITL